MSIIFTFPDYFTGENSIQLKSRTILLQDAEDLVKDANAGNVKFTVAGEEVQVDEGVLDPDVAGSVLIVVPTGKQINFCFNP